MEALETNFKAFVTSNSQVSETKEARAARKRADGLKRQQLQSSMVLNNQNIDVDAFDVLDSISSIWRYSDTKNASLRQLETELKVQDPALLDPIKLHLR